MVDFVHNSFCLLSHMYFGSSYCKQYGPRSGSKPFDTLIEFLFKVSKDAKIRNRYNEVPHLTQDTNGKVTNSQIDTTNKSQEVSPFPAGDHKAHITDPHKGIATVRQKKHKRSTKEVPPYFTGGLEPVLGRANLTLNSDVDQDT